MAKHFRLVADEVEDDEPAESSWGDYEPGIVMLDGHGCCPQCGLGPYGPNQVHCFACSEPV